MSRLIRGLELQRRWLPALLWVSCGLSGCVMFREPITAPAPPAHPAPGSVTPGPAIPTPAAPANAEPAPPPSPPVTAPPAAHQFHLGPAATALVAQAHRQAAADPQLAISTLERALRIEPDNPLLWIELGEVHESAGHYEQAGGIGHKALQLATGDPHAQSASWHLIAESLKARNRNGEAAEAQHRADELSAQ
ncbi:MAG TPA: tetratricopeptide repeat protein [Steroidobacteraceae bacterium]|jgi:tetratricopeptide (TPR) repeat protein|nr:tetratricopeptide repeat protein [Steroidobacteraceae bacterium]